MGVNRDRASESEREKEALAWSRRDSESGSRMLSVELASHHPAEVAASRAEGQITHVGGHVVHLFNDEHFSKVS